MRLRALEEILRNGGCSNFPLYNSAEASAADAQDYPSKYDDVISEIEDMEAFAEEMKNKVPQRRPIADPSDRRD